MIDIFTEVNHIIYLSAIISIQTLNKTNGYWNILRESKGKNLIVPSFWRKIFLSILQTTENNRINSCTLNVKPWSIVLVICFSVRELLDDIKAQDRKCQTLCNILKLLVNAGYHQSCNEGRQKSMPPWTSDSFLWVNFNMQSTRFASTFHMVYKEKGEQLYNEWRKKTSIPKSNHYTRGTILVILYQH